MWELVASVTMIKDYLHGLFRVGLLTLDLEKASIQWRRLDDHLNFLKQAVGELEADFDDGYTVDRYLGGP